MKKTSNNHLSYEPTNEEFSCPKCKAPVGIFHVAESDGCDNPICDLLHKTDILCCMDCGHTTTASKFARYILKSKDMEKCRRCNGRGMSLKSKMIELYCPFYDAPEHIRNICSDNGGDEDWIAIFPPGHPDIPHRDEFGEWSMFSLALRDSVCSFDVYELEGGRVAVVSCHA